MVKKIIYGVFLYTVMIASIRALQRLFHWGSGLTGWSLQVNDFRT